LSKRKMSNPMLQNLNNPVARLGIIPGKAQPDWYQIREGQLNAEDPTVVNQCYAGGSKEINHDIMPGDLSFGRKCVRNHQAPPGEPNELGIVSLAGMYHPRGHPMRYLEDQFYLQGVVVTECRVSDPMGNPGATDPDSGYAMVKAGTISIINNGPMPFYPGQLIAWRFPHLSREYEAEMYRRARGGTVASQIKPEVVPFDYTDSTLQLKGALAGLGLPKSEGGVSDMTLSEFFAPDGYSLDDSPMFSAESETAGALKFGVAAIVLGALQHLAAEGFITINVDADGKGGKGKDADAKDKAIGIATFLKVFGTSNSGTATEFDNMLIKTIFAADLATGPPTSTARLNKSSTEADQYDKLLASGGKFISTLSHGAWHSKTSKVMGRATAYAATSDTLHTLMGHTLI
jgi:hypothetical protein